MCRLRRLCTLMVVVFVTSSVRAELPGSKSVKLGAIASLSGPAAEQGKNWLNGAQLAVKTLREEGIAVDLIIEDDSTTPAAVNSAFEKLASIDHVQGIIGGTWDFLAEAAGPIAQKYKIPFVTPSNPVEILSDTTRKNKWVFTNGLSMRATESAMEGVLRKLKVKTAAIIVPNVPFGTAHAALVEHLAEKMGISIQFRIDFEYGGYQDTLRTLAAKSAEKKPELIFCLTDYAALGVFWKEVRRRDFEPWLLTTQHLDEAVRLTGTPELWRKGIGIYPQPPDGSFTQKFIAEYGVPPKVYSAEGYDAAIFLARALAKGISLGDAPFSTAGIAGKLSSQPGKTEIESTPAVALKVGAKGELEPFAREAGK